MYLRKNFDYETLSVDQRNFQVPVIIHVGYEIISIGFSVINQSLVEKYDKLKIGSALYIYIYIYKISNITKLAMAGRSSLYPHGKTLSTPQ